MGMKMLGTINKVILVGFLVKDPEIRQLQSGSTIAVFFLMTRDGWENKRNQQHIQKTEYFKVIVFGKALIEQVQSGFKKNDHIYLEGQLRIRRWQDDQQNDHYNAEIVLFSHNGVLNVLNDYQTPLTPIENKLPISQS